MSANNTFNDFRANNWLKVFLPFAGGFDFIVSRSRDRAGAK
jgi:hypothetical protein